METTVQCQRTFKERTQHEYSAKRTYIKLEKPLTIQSLEPVKTSLDVGRNNNNPTSIEIRLQRPTENATGVFVPVPDTIQESPQLTDDSFTKNRSTSTELTYDKQTSIRKQNCHEPNCSYCFPRSQSSTRLQSQRSLDIATRQLTSQYSFPVYSEQNQTGLTNGTVGSLRCTANGHIGIPVRVTQQERPTPKPRSRRTKLPPDELSDFGDQTDRSICQSSTQSAISTHPPTMTFQTEPSRSESSSSRRSTPRSELFTQMEPLFPQYATLHKAPKKHYCSSEVISNDEIVRDCGESMIRTKQAPIVSDGGDKPVLEVHFVKPDTTENQSVIRADDNGLRSVELTFERNSTSGFQQFKENTFASRIDSEQVYPTPGVENVQLMKATDKPAASIAYLPRSDVRSPQPMRTRSPIPSVALQQQQQHDSITHLPSNGMGTVVVLLISKVT